MSHVKQSVGEENWNDIIIPGGSLGAGSSAPDPISLPGNTNVIIYGFDGGSTTEQLYAQFEIPHDYQELQTIYPHVHWCPTTAGTGNVAWYMDYSYANAGDAMVSGATISGLFAASGLGVHQIAALPEIGDSTLRIGALVCIRLYRVPTGVDTYAGDAGLLSVGVHYKSDTLGSSKVFTK